MASLGFIGLGIMGLPICSRLVAAGHRVTVYDKRIDAVRAAVSAGASASTGTERVAGAADIVFTSLPSPEIVRLVGETALEHLPEDGIWVDLSTVDPTTALTLHQRAAAAGRGFLEAPISGGPRAARAGRLSVMVGGERDLLDRLQPVFTAFADSERVFYCGGRGSAATVKLANNLVEIGSNLLLAEAFGLVADAEVDCRTAYEVMRRSSARCALLDDWGETILAGDFDPALNATLDIIAKDMRLAVAHGAGRGIEMEITELVSKRLEEARERGWGSESMTVVGRLQEARVGKPFRFRD